MAPAARDAGEGWTDSHCHLQDLDDAASALARARDAGVVSVVCVGTGAQSSARALELARSAIPAGVAVWATAGLHPHDAKDGLEDVEALVRSHAPALGAPRPPGSLVGIGECGLDYHYDHSPRAVQRAVFARQVALASELDLTLVIHTREAWEDTFSVLAAEGVPRRTVLHCFTGGPEEARRCLDLGIYLSFSGIVTFKGAPEVRDAAAVAPIEQVLVETDAPFLAPVPHRGRPNEPAFVAVVGEALAATVGRSPEELARATGANAAEAFGIGQLPAPG